MASIKTQRGELRYTPKSLYVGIKQIDKVKALENLRLLDILLKSKEITWGPIFGTLLGIVRDNDFITWDEDIDLYILKEQEDMFRNVLWDLSDNGFSLIRYERRGLYSIMRNGEYIDFYVLAKIQENLRETGGGGYVFEKYIRDTIPYNFKGIELNIPREYDEFLTLSYNDWRTPVQYANFEMNSFQKSIKKFIYWVKNHLPDFVYYPLLQSYHRKDYIRFKNRCMSRGLNIDGM